MEMMMMVIQFLFTYVQIQQPTGQLQDEHK
jgi:hypothetical protein